MYNSIFDFYQKFSVNDFTWFDDEDKHKKYVTKKYLLELIPSLLILLCFIFLILGFSIHKIFLLISLILSIVSILIKFVLNRIVDKNSIEARFDLNKNRLIELKQLLKKFKISSKKDYDTALIFYKEDFLLKKNKVDNITGSAKFILSLIIIPTLLKIVWSLLDRQIANNEIFIVVVGTTAILFFVFIILIYISDLMKKGYMKIQNFIIDLSEIKNFINEK